MKLNQILDEIKLELTGLVLEMEIDDATLKQVVNKALRELERYWDETTLLTVPFASCIDLSGKAFEEHVSSIVRVYRTEGIGNNENNVNSMTDPMFAQQWLMFSNAGTTYNLNDYVMNYAAWSTVSQIKNSMSTDMSFKEDRHNKKLYINNYMSAPSRITIEYIPKLRSVEDIKSDYWIDILIKLCIALTKIILGRIRTRFTQSNALWAQDGEKLLEEGNTSYKELQEVLRLNSNMVFPID